MSCTYITIPKIKFDDILNIKSLKLSDPPSYCRKPNNRHKVLSNNDVYVHIYEDDEGNCRFERYGSNDIHQIFPNLIAEFDCRI